MGYNDNQLRPVHVTIISLVAISMTVILLVSIALFVYKDAQAGKKVNETCITNGGALEKVDIKYDGLPKRRVCIL